MDTRPPIDRIRDRENEGPEPQASETQVFTEKEARLDREAAVEHDEKQSDEAFEKNASVFLDGKTPEEATGNDADNTE